MYKKTLITVLMLSQTILCNSYFTQAQSWRVEKLKTDSADLNKMVYAVMAADEGSSERKYMFDNIQKRFPQFMRLVIRDARNKDLMGALYFANRNSSRKIQMQGLDDRFIATAFKVKGMYIKQGYDEDQADALVLEKLILNSCVQTNTGKDVVRCVTGHYQQYLEDSQRFTSNQVEALVTRLQNSLERESGSNTKKKPTGGKTVRKH